MTDITEVTTDEFLEQYPEASKIVETIQRRIISLAQFIHDIKIRDGIQIVSKVHIDVQQMTMLVEWAIPNGK
jgi:phosphopantetheine adenylyltransferase